MDASDDLSELLDLVNTHLSKASLQPSTSREDMITGSASTSTQYSIPQFFTHQPFKTDPVVAQQIANSMKAREAERLQKEAEDKSDEPKPETYRIDLTGTVISAVKQTQLMNIVKPSVQTVSVAQETEIEEPKTEEIIQFKKVEPLLPCKLNHSELLFVKIKRKRVSAFGKVLCARYVPNKNFTYSRNRLPIAIKHYQFQGPSPDDLMKEKMKTEPKGFDVMSYYGLEMSESLRNK